MLAKRSFIAFILSVLLLILSLTACGQNLSTTQETTTPIDTEITEQVPTPPSGIIFAGPADTECTVVYPASSTELNSAANELADYVKAVIPTACITATCDADAKSATLQIVLCEPDSSLPYDYSLKLQDTTLMLYGRNDDHLLDAISYLKAFCIKNGYLAVDTELDFTSNEGPAVLSQYPEKYYYYEDIYTPTLAYAFDGANVDVAGCRLIVGGKDCTELAVWEKNAVTLAGVTVPAGDHTVLLALSDTSGNVGFFETTFSCGDGSVMNLYAGEIHAHTSDSDGKETVEKAYAYARDIAKLDFFAVTDHSGSFTDEIYTKSHIPNADSFNEPGVFAALYGYEQTYSYKTGYYGHLNTICRGKLTKTTLSLEGFYSYMAKEENAVVMFNHPGYTWGNFLEYDLYSPEIDAVLNLSEIKSTTAANYEYALSLTKGWHVSPIYNEDNHNADWGNAKEACGYVLAPALTRQNILDAFNKNRTYTTTDKTLKIYYKINDEWMGSRLDAPDKLHFCVQLSTEKSQGLGTVSIIAEDGIVVASEKIGSKKEYTLELDLPPLYDYYYIKVESGSNWAYTAPIWIENREQLTVGEMWQELVINNDNAKDYRIYTTVTNNSSIPITDVSVDFYLAANSGFTLAKQNPLQTVKVSEIAPGETVTVSADVNYSPSMPRVYAMASGMQNGNAYGAVNYMEISKLYVSEILPLIGAGGSDEYEYIEIYNNSDTAFNLSNVKIRYYSKSGANAELLAQNTWTLSGKIQPHSALVIWVVSENNKLTVADFNKKFGTALVEGEDIQMITGANIPHQYAVQLEVLIGTSVIGRVWYNWGEDTDVMAGRSILFDYPTDHTITARVSKRLQKPSPGSIADVQMPALVTP